MQCNTVKFSVVKQVYLSLSLLIVTFVCTANLKNVFFPHEYAVINHVS